MKFPKRIVVGLAILLAFAGCAAPPALPLHVQRFLDLARAARRAQQAGRYDQAAALYRGALSEARKADDGAAVADAAYNAAVCCVFLSDYDTAEALLAEARYELERLGRPQAPVLLVEAAIALRLKQWDRFDRLASAVSSTLGAAEAPDQKAELFLLKAEAACLRKELPEAQGAFEQARTFLPDITDPFIPPKALMVEGDILSLQGSPLKAASKYDRAAQLYRRLNSWKLMAHALSKAASAYLKAGRAESAVDKAFRAARSFKAQGDPTQALRTIKALLPASPGKADKAPLWQPLRRLFDEIHRELNQERYGRAVSAGSKEPNRPRSEK